jgi:cytochrome c biogenesis factor
MEIFLIIVLLLLVPATYMLFNIRANKKQTNRKNRINWRH